MENILLSEEELLEDTEEKLKTYFKRENILKTIDVRINSLKERIDQIKNDLKEVNISIPEESRAITYEERVQTSSTGISYAESSVMNITSKMQKLLEKKKLELIDLEEERYNIEADNKVIDENIKELKKEYIDIISLIYGKGYTEEAVARKLNIDRSNVNRRKISILRNVEHWLYLRK
ncbi:hypothetical protein [Clostridium baratii]|uniref:hypothetical protein n=1 Tax=Clostridium baratii TaxID=1561 RepID=UPI0030CE772F